jgi:hypothetical protein
MSSVRAHLAGQLANEGRLASAVWTDDGMEFAGPDSQVKGSGGNHGSAAFYESLVRKQMGKRPGEKTRSHGLLTSNRERRNYVNIDTVLFEL